LVRVSGEGDKAILSPASSFLLLLLSLATPILLNLSRQSYKATDKAMPSQEENNEEKRLLLLSCFFYIEKVAKRHSLRKIKQRGRSEETLAFSLEREKATNRSSGFMLDDSAREFEVRVGEHTLGVGDHVIGEQAPPHNLV
jgi:hypothetical protein